MKHLFVPLDIARELYLLGFNEPCFAIYHYNSEPEIGNTNLLINFNKSLSYLTNSNLSSHSSTPPITAPLYQQVVDWFRLNHNLYLNIDHVNNPEPEMWGYDVCRMRGGGIIDMWDKTKSVKDYYENFNNAIKSAIQIIKR